MRIPPPTRGGVERAISWPTANAMNPLLINDYGEFDRLLPSALRAWGQKARLRQLQDQQMAAEWASQQAQDRPRGPHDARMIDPRTAGLMKLALAMKNAPPPRPPSIVNRPPPPFWPRARFG